MNFNIEDDNGEIIAKVKSANDVAHVYKVFGPPHKISNVRRKLLYPFDVDNPEWDTPRYISARVIERSLRGKRHNVGPVSRAGRPRVIIGRHKGDKALSWKNQNKNRFKVQSGTVTLASKKEVAKNQQHTV